MTQVETDVGQLWQEYRERPTVELRNRLVEMYLPLVKYNGERIWARLPDGVELDDLISAGVFGLMDAIDAFDLGRGVKFETYCVPRIRGAMLDELRSMDWVPRLVRSGSPTPRRAALPEADRQAVLNRRIASATEADRFDGPPLGENAQLAAELVELRGRLPFPAPGETAADWVWLDRELGRGPAGELGPYAGRHVAVYRGQAIDADDNPLRLRLRASQALQPQVNPERLVVAYIDPWDHVEG